MIDLYTKTENGIQLRDYDPFFKFPAGECHMKNEPGMFTGEEIAVVRGTNLEDYMHLVMWSRVVRDQGGIPHAVIPYLPAAQADREEPCGAQLYGAWIMEGYFESITCFDPHSEVMPDYLEEWSFGEKVNVVSSSIIADQFKGYDGIIAPDKGAVKRATEFAEVLGIPVFTAGKSRNFQTGQLTDFTPPENLDSTKRYLVVDDICVGGGTFIGLAKAIKEKYGQVELDLYVSHGVFSNGISRLNWHYYNIYTTNSLIRDGLVMPTANRIDIVTKLLEMV